MTTAQTLVDETRRILYSNQISESNRLNGAITSNATSLALKYSLGTAQLRGAVLAIDLEEIRVWEYSGNSITVCERGVNGTTAAAHSDLAYVEVQPKFSPFRVLNAINEDLDDLSSPGNGLFQVKTVDLTYNPVIQGYNLSNATAVTDIAFVKYSTPGPSKYFPVIRNWRLDRNMNSSDFTSTFALQVLDSAYPGLPIHVGYKAPFTRFTNLTDDAQSVAGLPSTANDLPPLGAAIRLMAGREIKRNFTESQFDPKREQDVPAGAVLRSYQGLVAVRQQRIRAEALRLAVQYPRVR